MQKILVVEDESVIRTALRRLLERNGYEVSEAGSVQQAEADFNFVDFDLIISDLRLPGAPGTDLIQQSRRCASTDHDQLCQPALRCRFHAHGRRRLYRQAI